MKTANAIIDNLLKQQDLLMGTKKALADGEAVLEELRKAVPPQIQGHFDRLMDRGKRGVALVRNGVCCECHMRVAIGVLATLSHGDDIQLCGTCGRYLCLAEPEPATEVAPVAPAPKVAVRKRKRKVATDGE